MANKAEERWIAYRDRLMSDLVDAEKVIVEIPDWEPVELDLGLRWLQATIYEAFQVDHAVVWTGKTAIVRFRFWEEGWDE